MADAAPAPDFSPLPGDAEVLLGLSGGLDSSALYAGAHRISHAIAPLGITWSTADGGPGDELQYIHALELQYGQAVARGHLSPTHEPHSDELEVRYGEFPVPNNMPGTAARAFAAARAAGADVILDGGWADHLLAPHPPLHLVTLFSQFRWATFMRQLRGHMRYRPASEHAAIVRQLMRAVIRAHAPTWLLNLRKTRLNAHQDPGPF